MLRSIFLLLACLLPLLGITQEWEWESRLDASQGTAFHDIYLSPNATALLNSDYGNLRLFDAEGEQVPYLLFSEKPSEQEMQLKWYDKVREDYWRRWYSRSYFRNPRTNTIDRMVLKIRNADVTQHFWLSGSDDMTHWYIIKEDYSYDAAWDPGQSYNLMTIDFPPVDYKYYKVEIRHHWREPIQILGAGFYTIRNTEDGNYQKAPEPKLIQTESGTESVVDIAFKANHYMDRIFFEVDGPDMFHREAMLEMRVRTAEGVVYYSPLQSFTLTSRGTAPVEFEGLRAETLRLRIENKDDKPLRIAAVQAYELKKYITAKLQKGDAYTLRVGDESLRRPDYDLEYFVDELPERRPSLFVQELTWLRRREADSLALAVKSMPQDSALVAAKPEAPKKEEKSVPFFQQKAVLWGGIVLMVLLMGFMAIKMLKELPKADETGNADSHNP